jgi:tRNA A37 threonylcarbamoyltransferase TsaD
MEEDKAEISRVFQQAAVRHLIMQFERAMDLPLDELRLSGRTPDVRILQGEDLEERRKKVRLGQVVKGLVVSGGVASNKYLRHQ